MDAVVWAWEECLLKFFPGLYFHSQLQRGEPILMGHSGQGLDHKREGLSFFLSLTEGHGRHPHPPTHFFSLAHSSSCVPAVCGKQPDLSLLFPSSDREDGSHFLLEKRPVYSVLFSSWCLFFSTSCVPCDQLVLGLRRRKCLIESLLPGFPATGFHIQAQQQ